MNNKIIILALCLFLFISFIFLSYAEKQQADINTKNTWMIYFQNPKDESLNFSIENHSKNTNFHWQILADDMIIKEENISAFLGETKTIPVSSSPTNLIGRRVQIIVSAGEEKKMIYKNL